MIYLLLLTIILILIVLGVKNLVTSKKNRRSLILIYFAAIAISASLFVFFCSDVNLVVPSVYNKNELFEIAANKTITLNPQTDKSNTDDVADSADTTIKKNEALAEYCYCSYFYETIPDNTEVASRLYSPLFDQIWDPYNVERTGAFKALVNDKGIFKSKRGLTLNHYSENGIELWIAPTFLTSHSIKDTITMAGLYPREYCNAFAFYKNNYLYICHERINSSWGKTDYDNLMNVIVETNKDKQ